MNSRNSNRILSLAGRTSFDHLTKEDGIHKELVGAKPEGTEVGVVCKAYNSTSALSGYTDHCALLYSRQIAWMQVARSQRIFSID